MQQKDCALKCSEKCDFLLTFSAALGNMSKLYCTRLHENSRQAKANKFSLVFWLNEIVHRYIPFGALCGRFAKRPENAPFQSALIYAIFYPKNPAHPSLIHVSVCLKVVYVCIVEASNQSQPSISVLGCFFFVYNTRPPKNSEADIFCYPRVIFS